MKVRELFYRSVIAVMFLFALAVGFLGLFLASAVPGCGWMPEDQDSVTSGGLTVSPTSRYAEVRAQVDEVLAAYDLTIEDVRLDAIVQATPTFFCTSSPSGVCAGNTILASGLILIGSDLAALRFEVERVARYEKGYDDADCADYEARICFTGWKFA